MNPLSMMDLVLASILGLASAGVSILLSLGFQQKLFWSIVRMIIQLLCVGFLLKLVFTQDNPAITLAVLLVMLLAATREVGARLPNRLTGVWQLLVSGSAVTLSTMFVSTFSLLAILGTGNWLNASHAIPITGIILGSAMNSASLTLNSLLTSVKSDRNTIEAQLALGATKWVAVRPLVRRSAYAGLLPVMNQMVGAGIITMPGIMSGQILAGQEPIEAAKYQIFLMLLLASSSVASVVIAAYMTMFRLTDDRHRLRLDRLTAKS